jgi:hypothetical protein
MLIWKPQRNKLQRYFDEKRDGTQDKKGEAK